MQDKYYVAGLAGVQVGLDEGEEGQEVGGHQVFQLAPETLEYLGGTLALQCLEVVAGEEELVHGTSLLCLARVIRERVGT